MQQVPRQEITVTWIIVPQVKPDQLSASWSLMAGDMRSMFDFGAACVEVSSFSEIIKHFRCGFSSEKLRLAGKAN